MRSELREPRPLYWIFQSKYPGPDERRLRGVVTEAGFTVRREPIREAYGDWPNMVGPLPAARGTIVASEAGSVIVLTPDIDFVALASYLLLLTTLLCAGFVFLPLAPLVLFASGLWVYGVFAEWQKLTEVIATILDAA